MTEQSPKVALEVAEAEFDRFCDAMLDVEPAEFDEEDRSSFDGLRRKMVKAIQRGHLAIDDRGRPVYTPRREEGDPRPITFNEPTGAALMAMDKRKKGEDFAKMLALLGAITKQPPKRFADMVFTDLDICQSIVVLFMGSR